MNSSLDYDLIVVGAGAGGAVVAARVSEDPRIRVLLIESGPDYPNVEALPEDLRNTHETVKSVARTPQRAKISSSRGSARRIASGSAGRPLKP